MAIEALIIVRDRRHGARPSVGNRQGAGIGIIGVPAIFLFQPISELGLLPRRERVEPLAGGFLRGEIQPGGQFTMQRSEEHTSELQSLMRISYAVFCLKKKNT